MSTVRVYKSTDPGAPPHPTETRGSLAALLRACLVTGYGSGDTLKEPAGWEEPFDEFQHNAVFRAKSGARQFYRLRDDFADDPERSYLYGYDSMSDPVTGQGWQSGWNFGKCSRYEGNSVWYVIADERTCYIMLEGRYDLVPHGFGEFFSYLDLDPYNSFIAGHDKKSLPDYYGDHVSLMEMGDLNETNGVDMRFRSDLSSAGNPANGCPVSFFGEWIEGHGEAASGISGYNGLSVPIVPMLVSTEKERLVRGKLRGLYYPLAYRPFTHDEIFSQDGRDYLVVNVGYSHNSTERGQFLFDVTGSWEG